MVLVSDVRGAICARFFPSFFAGARNRDISGQLEFVREDRWKGSYSERNRTARVMQRNRGDKCE